MKKITILSLSYTSTLACINNKKTDIMKKSILLFAGLILLIFRIEAQTVTDYDGNIYNTVAIGPQVWMKENLKVSHYRNGNLIPNNTSPSSWCTLTSAAYCNYNNDTSNAGIYGNLYNWYAVNNSAKLCPTNWHVPSDAEWTSLENYLGGGNAASLKLKEAGTGHWSYDDGTVTNSSGFSALPGGSQVDASGDCIFSGMNNLGQFWTSTSINSDAAWNRVLWHTNGIYRWDMWKFSGYSVRCISDFPTEISDNTIENQIQISPNPNNGIFSIILPNIIIETQIEIYNTLGERIYSTQINTDKFEMDLSNKPKGIYFYHLQNDKKILETGTILIQ